MGVQTTPDWGMNWSPKNRKPPPLPLKQWPTTLRIRPREWSCDTMLVLPFPSPRTPAVEGGGLWPGCVWSYPHLPYNTQKTLTHYYKWMSKRDINF